MSLFLFLLLLCLPDLTSSRPEPRRTFGCLHITHSSLLEPTLLKSLVLYPAAINPIIHSYRNLLAIILCSTACPPDRLPLLCAISLFTTTTTTVTTQEKLTVPKLRLRSSTTYPDTVLRTVLRPFGFFPLLHREPVLNQALLCIPVCPSPRLGLSTLSYALFLFAISQSATLFP